VTRPTILAFALVMATSPARGRAETFADDYFRGLESGYYPPFALRQDTSFTKGPFVPTTPDERKLLDLYATSLPTKPASWLRIYLPSPLKIPVGGVRLPLSNEDFLWALDKNGKKLGGFRSVSTSTGCASGCAPVVFHLRFDAEGRPEAVIQDPLHPLRKLGHSPFTPADLARLDNLIKKLPRGLVGLSRPSDAANEDESFPAQTWTVFRPMLIEGGAYTSYRVFESVLGVVEGLRTLAEGSVREGEDAQSLIGIFYRTEEIPKAVSSVLKRARTLLAAPATPRLSRQVALEYSAPLLAWAASRFEISEDDAFEWLPMAAYREQRPGALCLMYRRLLVNEKSAKLLSKMLKRPARWPSCGVETDRTLGWLAASRTGEVSRLKELAGDFANAPLPRTAVSGSDELLLFLEGARKSGALELERRVVAQTLVRFPRAADRLGKTDTAELAKLRAEAEVQALEETRRLLSDPADPMPSVIGLRGQKKVALPLRGQARLYVFFASWCPHCKATLARWVRDHGKDEAFWKRLTLVEVWPREKSLAEFCTQTGLSKAHCAGIVSLPKNEKTDEFYVRIGLTGVPRLAGTDAQGRWRIPDLEIPLDPASDFAVFSERVLKVLAEKP